MDMQSVWARAMALQASSLAPPLRRQTRSPPHPMIFSALVSIRQVRIRCFSVFQRPAFSFVGAHVNRSRSPTALPALARLTRWFISWMSPAGAPHGFPGPCRATRSAGEIYVTRERVILALGQFFCWTKDAEPTYPHPEAVSTIPPHPLKPDTFARLSERSSSVASASSSAAPPISSIRMTPCPGSISF